MHPSQIGICFETATTRCAIRYFFCHILVSLAAASKHFSQLVKAIVRPPRAEYQMAELGPARFEYGGVTFIREDMSFTNPRGLKLQASMWRKQELLLSVTHDSPWPVINH